jgi:Optic atrophy 3 protein (OPA3)
MEIWSAGYKIRTISPITEEKALKEGSEFVGEFFVLSVSITLLVLEYNRSANKDAEKAEMQRVEAAAERKELQRKLRALDLRLQALERTVESNSQSMFAVLHGGAQYKPPPKAKLVKIVDDDIDFSDDDDNEEEQKVEKIAELKEIPVPNDSSTSAPITTRSTSTTEGVQAMEQNQRRSWWWPW